MLEPNKIKNQVLRGDNLELLKKLTDNSVDAIVTDPPYFIGFMGKEFDKTENNPAINVELWKECLRVLKPGGHLLAFGACRTHHRLFCAIEDAGFKIRDCLSWIFGCLSDDTQLVNKKGEIVDRKSVNIGDEILCFDTQKNEYFYAPVKQKYEYDIEDTCYRIQSNFTDQLVSRSHRCIVERGGKQVFCRAEALEQQENLPFLENMPALHATLSRLHEGTGHEKQNVFQKMLQRIFKPDSFWKTSWIASKKNFFGMCGLREKTTATREGGSTLRNPGLQLRMQRENSHFGVGETLSQGSSGMDGGKFQIVSGKNDWTWKSSMEGWSYNFQEAWELLWGSLRSLSARSCFDGPQRWLRHATPVSYGEANRAGVNTFGSRPPHQSRSKGQQDRKLDVVCEQFRTQAVRAWEGHKTALATVTPVFYKGKIWCVEVESGAFVAVRNGQAFPTGNSGFPKSTNISKQIQKINGVQPTGRREPTGGITGGKNSGATDKGWNNIENWYEMPPAEAENEKRWVGYGSAMKPGYEPICMARKPISEKNLALNVLKWGTGGLNIDGCRIGAGTGKEKPPYEPNDKNQVYGKNLGGGDWENTNGRWPANLIFECICDEILVEPETIKDPEIVGGGIWNTRPHTGKPAGRMYSGGAIIHTNPECPCYLLDQQSEGASRFFYCAKSARKEKEAGLDHLESQNVGMSNGAQIHGEDYDKGQGIGLNRVVTVKNTHPCLHPSSLVLSDTGWEEIQNVKIGDKVYSEDGLFHTVIDTTAHPYNQDAYEISVFGTNISVTASNNHPFLIYRPKRENKSIVGYEIDWIQAEDLRVGDYTMTPVSQAKEQNSNIQNEDFWFLVGLWLAEGSFQKSGHGGKFSYPLWSLHKKEAGVITEKIKKYTTKKVSVYQRPSDGVSVIVFDKNFGDLIKNLCVGGAKSKRLQTCDFLNLPQLHRQAIFDGYIFGDGSVVREKLQAKTISLSLVSQMKLLSESLGFSCGFYRYDNTTNLPTIRGRKFLSRQLDYSMYFPCKNNSIQNRKPSKPTSVDHNGISYTLNFIKSVKPIHYQGDVLNLTVEDSPTFQTAVGMSHNTVKPRALMEYLIKLVCPPGGLVLDIFAGSGSTGVAAINLGFDFLLFELEEEYVKIAEARLAHARKQKDESARIGAEKQNQQIRADTEEVDLFGEKIV